MTKQILNIDNRREKQNENILFFTCLKIDMFIADLTLIGGGLLHIQGLYFTLFYPGV